MEIDFMGLYSKNPAPGYEPDGFVDSGIPSGESYVSLSLCTSSPMDEKTVFQDFLLKKKIRKSPAENMTPAGKYDWENGERSCPYFNRDDRSTISRNTFDHTLSFPASSTVFLPTAAPNLFPAQKADRKMYATGDASFDDTRKSKPGIISHTPTVAMARKATLARFLEKRSHRLNQQIKGRSLNWSETCEYYLYKTQQEDKKQHAV